MIKKKDKNSLELTIKVADTIRADTAAKIAGALILYPFRISTVVVIAKIPPIKIKPPRGFSLIG